MERDKYGEYKQHLKNAFLFIARDRQIQLNTPHLRNYASRLASQLGEGNDDNWLLSINPPWNLDIQNDQRSFQENEAYLLLSGVINVTNSDFGFYSIVASIVFKKQVDSSTSMLMIPYSEYGECNHLYTDRLSRRFHFDLATGKDKKNKPLSHIQFGGNETIFPSTNYHLNPRVEIPRIPYPPLDFIIMFDMILRQFKTKLNTKFYNNQGWVDIVKTSEQFRLINYYTNITNYLSSRRKFTLSEKLCDENDFYL